MTHIIAEVGVNHQGSTNLAKKMIYEASKAGCDFIKFQFFKANNLATKYAKKAKYQTANTKGNSQYEMLKKLEIKSKNLRMLKKFANKNKIKFLCSGFDIEDLKEIKKIGIKILKIPSGEIDNVNYLRFAGSNFKEIILSTGMATVEEIDQAIKILCKSGLKKKNLTILHCRSSYPTELKDLNLNSIIYLRNKFNCSTGFSDHSEGVQASVLATCLGAKIIEKHFTLNKKMKGPDHKASLNITELKLLVKKIRDTEDFLGGKYKKVTKDEIKNKIFVRKMIVAKKNILKGEKFTEKNICCKRPLLGIPASKWDMVINKKSKKNFKIDEPIKL
tara:strand:+ start:41 stop:1036 length:996 start_codon:yes stop_codon:yes gene_type:complete